MCWPITEPWSKGALRLLLCLLLWQLWPATAAAQTVTSIIRQFEVQDGLSQREVYSILEDANGFIWLGSEKSLQRFDGKDFATWSMQKDHPLLRDIYLLGIDADGWLWMFNNIDRQFLFFHTLTEEFQTAPERFGKDFPLYKDEHANGMYDLVEPAQVDSKGRMVLPMNSPRQVVYYDHGKGFSFGPLPPEVPVASTMLPAQRQDDLWFIARGEDAALYHVGADGSFRGRHPIPDFKELRLAYSTPDQLAIRTDGDSGGTFITVDFKTAQVSAFPAGEESSRLFANGFVMRLLPGRWEVASQEHPDRRLLSLDLAKQKPSSHKGIKLVYPDSKGRLWIGGEWGLTSWDVRPGKFDRYIWFDEGQDKPFNNTVRGIYADDSTLYVNFESVGLAEVPLHHPDAWQLMDPAVRSKDLKQAFLSSRPLIRLHDGNLMLAQSAKLMQLNPRNGDHKTLALDEKDFWHIWSLHEDSQNRLWVGGEGVLGLVHPDGSVEKIELWPGNKIWKVVYQFLPDGKGNLWLSTHTGLLLFDPERKRVVATYGQDQQGGHHLPANVIHHHHIAHDSIHWLATDQGLVEWNPRTQTSHLYTTLDGLSSDVVYGIFEDKAGMLWLSSDYGIMRFHKESHSVRTYLENEGISNTEFNRTAWFQSANGTIYFGGMNGVTAIRPDGFTEDRMEKPVIQVTGFELFDRVQNKSIKRAGALRASHSFTLGPDVGYVRISFAIPNPLDDNLILYAWRLKDNGENWSYQKDNFLQLAQLGYGTHHLQIKGKDHAGNWSAPIEITILVPRPFYLQTWFFILLGALLLLGVYIFLRSRTAVLRRRQLQLEAEIEQATAKILEDKQTIARQVEELQQLDKTKSRFFANVAHEFRTPLTLIYGPLNTVIHTGEINPASLRLLQTARENTDSLVKMIGSIMDLTKLESGKMELHEAPLLLKPWITQFAAAFESLTMQKGIEFKLSYHGRDDFAFEVDKEKLHTILKNLLANAVKFTPAGRQISIQATATALEVVITVRDTGRGIHPDDLPHIFERYYQSRQPGAPVEGGTGIGLALCKEFAKIMQGRLSVESRLGEGSSFSLWLPHKQPSGPPLTPVVAEPTIEVESEAVVAPMPPPTAGKHHLLVVEDHPSLQEYLKAILSPAYSLTLAANGRQALDLLQAMEADKLPDLVISDVMMPEMDGFQLLEALKGSREWAHLPVIMLTARAGLEDKLRALQIGVDDYLTKPFEEVELLTRVANLLRNAAARSEALVEEPATTASPPELPQADREWLTRLEDYVSARVQDSSLSVTQLCSEFAMSESTFRRQVKRLAGLTPQEYLNEHKLNRARQLLESGTALGVAQVAEEVGYEDAKAFTRSFKSRFGKPPSAFLR